MFAAVYWAGKVGELRVMVLNTTSLLVFWSNEIELCFFNSSFFSDIERVRLVLEYGISIISWWSVLLVEETGVPGEIHRPAANHIMLYPVHIG
jgi:hypothetical protein